jgi:hypothetical protein
MFVAEFLKQGKKFSVSKSRTLIPVITNLVVLRNYTFVRKKWKNKFLFVLECVNNTYTI